LFFLLLLGWFSGCHGLFLLLFVLFFVCFLWGLLVQMVWLIVCGIYFLWFWVLLTLRGIAGGVNRGEISHRHSLSALCHRLLSAEFSIRWRTQIGVAFILILV
jgi:hypothetical protein